MLLSGLICVQWFVHDITELACFLVWLIIVFVAVEIHLSLCAC